MEKCLGYLKRFFGTVDIALRCSWQLIFSCIAMFLILTGQFQLIDIVWVLLAHYVLYTLGLEIGYHKLLTHRSFTTHTVIKNILATIGILTCHPPALQWVALHRLHHGYSDKPKDPHSPWQPKRGLLAYLFLVKWPSVDFNPEFKNDSYLRWISHNQGTILWLATIPLLFVDLKTFLVWFAIPSIISPYCLGIANYYTHQGKHNGYDHARNFYWVELIAPGMGFHGNHHDSGSTWSLAKKYWWIDLSSIVVKLIKR
jgi:sn-1 stearoyl-lipid 9-desaturase